MKAQDYAQALCAATRAKQENEIEAILNRLLDLLRSEGHLRLLPDILREVEKYERREHTSHGVTVKLASLDDLERLEDRIEEDVRMLTGEDLSRKVLIDETLIGGYEVRAKGYSIDRSHKRSLLTLYNTLLTNNAK